MKGRMVETLVVVLVLYGIHVVKAPTPCYPGGSAGCACDPNCANGCMQKNYYLGIYPKRCDGVCKPKYGINTAFRCLACDPNCHPTKTCNNAGPGKCDVKCKAGYRLNGIKKCQPCDVNCKKFGTGAGCQVRGLNKCDNYCITGYEHTGGPAWTCILIACDSNCAGACSTQGSGKCDASCNAGYSLQADYTCALCDANCADGCATVGAGKCETTCNAGYDLDGSNVCIVPPTTAAPTTAAPTTAAPTTTAPATTAPATPAPTTAAPTTTGPATSAPTTAAPTTAASTTDAPTTAAPSTAAPTTAAPTTAGSTTPLVCDANCADGCATVGAGKCETTCNAGYALDGSNYCIACEVTSCQTCNSGNVSVCDDCLNGYTLVDNACEACASNCITCDTEGVGLCDDGGCAPGYTDTANQLCGACDSNCNPENGCNSDGPGWCDDCSGQDCGDSTSTNSCKDLYTLGATDYGGGKYRCEACDLNCRPAVGCMNDGPGYCDSCGGTPADCCVDGYVAVAIGPKYYCAPCDTYCAGTCVNMGAGKCDATCVTGYRFDGTDDCEPCSSNCISCDTNGMELCDVCEPNYKLSAINVCLPCATHCVSGCDTEGAGCCDSDADDSDNCSIGSWTESSPGSGCHICI